MTTFMHTLQPLDLPPDARILQPPRVRLEHVTPESPALSVMTDLRKVRAITINPDTPVDAALTVMIHAKVRMLVVIDASGVIVGVVSAHDLMGEAPLRIANGERIRRDEVNVQQVMTRADEIRPLGIRDVEHATVRDIVVHLIESMKRHALVVAPTDDESTYTVCGIFSAAQIGRQLGEDINVSEGAVQSFSELERMIA